MYVCQGHCKVMIYIHFVERESRIKYGKKLIDFFETLSLTLKFMNYYWEKQCNEGDREPEGP